MAFVLRILTLFALVSCVNLYHIWNGLAYLTGWYPPVSDNRLPFLPYLAVRPTLHLKGSYGVVPHGTPDTAGYRLYLWNAEGPISPFHDIPIYANDEQTVLNLVVEIPRWTNAKMEISNKDSLNPIRQSFKNGELRFTSNVFPYHGYLWNYGAFPQSWENPNCQDNITGLKGDNDPLDVLEIGTRVGKVGDVVAVKVLGALGLIDEGETDWKIFAIDVSDALASKIDDVCDIEGYFPGLLQASVEWFRSYKVPDGKPENTFAFGGEVQNKKFAETIVRKTHEHWKSLVMDRETKSDHSRTTVTLTDSPFYASREVAYGLAMLSTLQDSVQSPVERDDRWHFFSSENTSNCSSAEANVS